MKEVLKISFVIALFAMFLASCTKADWSPTEDTMLIPEKKTDEVYENAGNTIDSFKDEEVEDLGRPFGGGLDDIDQVNDDDDEEDDDEQQTLTVN
ncbi:MAG: hypothetical protein HRT74_13010 [Flavobacteriales bacterium]|nr:hypothetical protein [Flavobacteriales bacterium]